VTAARELGPSYSAAEVERSVAARWAATDYGSPDGRETRDAEGRESLPPFTIIMPPPNVTGGLHVGHALFVTLEDLMVRRARMQGRAALWLPGVDHASIAAQFVLDRIVEKEGSSRADLGRERYLERMHRFMDETRNTILGQFQRHGAAASPIAARRSSTGAPAARRASLTLSRWRRKSRGASGRFATH
jgi:valyl-tRNA synthetase